MESDEKTVPPLCPLQLARIGGRFFNEVVKVVSETFDRDVAISIAFFTIFRGRDTGASVSGRHIAQALDLPYETVRRQVRRLRQTGLCKTGPDGATVAAGFQDSERFRRFSDQIWRLSTDFAREAALALTDVRPPGAPTPPDKRQIARLVSDYMLDGLAMGRRWLDLSLVELMVLSAIGAVGGGPDQDGPADPVSAYAVAKAIGLPYETVRRTALRLTDLGITERVAGGAFAVSAHTWNSPIFVGLRAEFVQLTCDLLSRLVGGARPG